MLALSAILVAGLAIAATANPLDANIAYRSPFLDRPHLGYDTRSIHARIAKRQMTAATPFTDEHYPSWYGSDFSNSPFVYNGGITFTHRVASGDPFDTSVILWTRVEPAGPPPDQSVPICVRFGVWSNPQLSGQPVSQGDAFTSYDIDFTIKVEATRLRPDTKYWYQFADCTNPKTLSVIGATRTIASPDTPARLVNGGKPLTLAVFSCSNFPFGFFNAYSIATQNTSADLFIHLGDYLYEYKNGDFGDGTSIGRVPSNRELGTLTDYRTRMALYRTDEGLLDAHQNHPWITVWDDHEVADNTWKAGSTDSNDTAAGCLYNPSGTCFSDRKLNGVRSYHEWMPIRQVAADDKLRIWRNFQIGKLLDLTMLDTRQYDRDVTSVGYNTVVNEVSSFANRSIMGLVQENWFYDTLSASKRRGAVWRVIGQQIVFTQLFFGTFFNLDQWDGYRANRNRVLDHLQKNKIDNTVILSGDSHANWVSDLAHANDTTTYNPVTGQGALGVEFAGTAVTSPSPFGTDIDPKSANALSTQLVGINPDLQWSEGSFRGFFTLAVQVDSVNATYYALRNIKTANTDAFTSATFIVKAGENKLSRPIAGGKVAAGVTRNFTATP